MRRPLPVLPALAATLKALSSPLKALASPLKALASPLKALSSPLKALVPALKALFLALKALLPALRALFPALKALVPAREAPRPLLKGLATSATALALMGCSPSVGRPPVPPERILLIVVDTLRRDHLGVYGAELATPHIDALGRDGQVFERALSSFHQTTMTMGSLFTGRTPSIERGDRKKRLRWTGQTWCGMARLGQASQGGACIDPSLPTLAESLGGVGYWTAGIASNRLLYGARGYERGFDQWIEFASTNHAPTAAQVNHVARQLIEKRPSDRFFLYVHYMDVHSYAKVGVPYAETVGVVDAAVGELIEMLRRAGLLEGTAIIFTSDHGERLGEKHFLPGLPGHSAAPTFEYLVRIPLIVSPAVFPDRDADLRSDDLHRMILELAGVERRPAPDLEPGELFLGERYYQTYRRGRWKSVRERTRDNHMLIDLVADPMEKRDVADLHPDVVAEHRARMDELTLRLGSQAVEGRRLSEEDRARLRSLGYADTE